MFNLKDKIIVITGAGGFLGKNFCKFLISFNATVIGIDNNQEKLNDLKKFIINSKLNDDLLHTFNCNILDESKIIKTSKKNLGFHNPTSTVHCLLICQTYTILHIDCNYISYSI